MKKILLPLSVFILLVFICMGDVKKASYEEIKTSISLIEKSIRENNEDIIPIFSEAIEIEKRANSSYFAKKIKEKICKTTKMTEDKFDNLRENFSFFDISIGWAISQIKDISLEKVLREKDSKGWKEILKGINQKEQIIKKIRELNPKSESF